MCFLVWEGSVKKKSFEKWRVVDVRSENEARRLLGERGFEHYWNMVATFKPDRAEGKIPDQLDKILMWPLANDGQILNNVKHHSFL